MGIFYCYTKKQIPENHFNDLMANDQTLCGTLIKKATKPGYN
jgi:hypothetical protein